MRLWASAATGCAYVLTRTCCCRDEAHALLGDSSVDAAEAAKRLAEECGMVAITDGSRGSCICTLGRLLVRPGSYLP